MLKTLSKIECVDRHQKSCKMNCVYVSTVIKYHVKSIELMLRLIDFHGFGDCFGLMFAFSNEGVSTEQLEIHGNFDFILDQLPSCSNLLTPF